MSRRFQDEDALYFLWLAKLGHNITERVSIYGLFNLYHELDRGGFQSAPFAQNGFHPFMDDTWAEAGGGGQAELCHGLTFVAEALVPVVDEGFTTIDAFELRATLRWQF